MHKPARLNDLWFRILGIPLIALMGHIIFYNRNEAQNQPFGFWTIYLISLFETVIIWETVRLVILYFRRKFPSLKETGRRILFTLLAATLVTIAVRTLNIWVYDKTRLWGPFPFPMEAYLEAVLVAFLFVVIVSGVYEIIYFFGRWKDAAVEAESLKKENLQTQLDLLKSQINPHFLFNNFSSLASLILEDQQKAVEFVEELSTVYRYLLQANTRTLTSLKEELDFIDAYFRLISNRFGNGILLQKNIDEKFSNYQLPALTLQLLIENAIKHNAVLPDRPLIIQLQTGPDEQLQVTNNIQPKLSRVASGKTGLANIIRKYELLEQPPVAVEHTDTDFKVTVPLIKPER